MKINLRKELDEEIEFFVQKFIDLGWEREDISFIRKNVDFITTPNPEGYKNEDAKTSIGLVLFPKLLEYENDVTCPWICGRITMEYDNTVKYQTDSKPLQDIAKFMKDEIPKTGFKPFFDEDAFRGNFSRPKINNHREYIDISFYLNKDYPNGYWQNHAIE